MLMKNKKTLIGLLIFIVLIIIIILMKNINTDEASIFTTNLTNIYVATGGGFENLYL